MPSYFKFKLLPPDATIWKQIAHDHHTLWLGLCEIREFLSPLVFANIGLSTYFICLQVIDMCKSASFATIQNSKVHIHINFTDPLWPIVNKQCDRPGSCICRLVHWAHLAPTGINLLRRLTAK